MKALITKAAALSAAGVLLFTLAACKKKEEDVATDPYVYTPQGQTAAEGQTALPEEARFTVNQAWQKNFTLQYKYFDLSQSAETVTIRETRAEKSFAAEYVNNGDILYYKENGGNVDCFMIIKGEENVHSVIKGKSIGDLSSTFMKLSEVSASMPSLSNVLYMNEENVAGRACKKYIQRAYQNGVAKETVYVWVDKEYGFAARGESYDENNKLTVSWELVQFQAGGVTDGSIRVNLDDYTFTERDAED